MTGCGVTGKTSPFTLQLETPAMGEQMADIKIVSVELGEASSRLVPVGVYAWGKFSDEDLAVLEKSLRDTISGVNHRQYAQSDSALHLYTIIRRYLLAASNVEGAVLACIAWCATDENRNIVYHEQFYASKAAGMTTLGAIKNSVNKSIVLRIAQTAVNIASSTGESAIEPVLAENTYNYFEEAAEGTPKKLASYYTGTFDLGSAYYLYFGYLKSPGINLGWVKEPQHINWDGYLGKRDN
jgi:hypothetical protein